MGGNFTDSGYGRRRQRAEHRRGPRGFLSENMLSYVFQPFGHGASNARRGLSLTRVEVRGVTRLRLRKRSRKRGRR